MKTIFIVCACAFMLSFTNDKYEMLKPLEKHTLQVPEPSDITLSGDKQKYFVVSDNGFLFETDLDFKVTRKAQYVGLDCEGVYADENFVYVMDESLRKITLFDPQTLLPIRSNTLTYMGGRNKGFESLTYNSAKKRFITITEKNPILIWELDENLNKVAEYTFTGASDVSGCCFHDGNLFLLSDEERKIMKVDPNNYSVLSAWTIPVLNPEGITFSPDGKVVISSDDMSKAFVFNSLQ